MTTGPTKPNGSKIDAISDNMFRFVTTFFAQLGTGGTLNLNVSELASQNSPKVFLTATAVSKSFDNSISSSGTIDLIKSIYFDDYFRNFIPAAPKSAVSCVNSSVAFSLDSAPPKKSSI